jgi:hypothetical protein
MLRRLCHIAPAVTGALVLAGCSFFVSAPPPIDIASDLEARSLKDAWAPTTLPVTKVSAVPAGKPRVQGYIVRPQTAASCTTDAECVVILSALINDPKRSWIGQPQSAAEYANGTRFFAYRALKSRLSCRELRLASRDTKTAAARLSAPASGLSAVQAANALSLSSAVGAELRGELARRCGPAPPQTQAHAFALRRAPA